jgi:hypothetical protein
LSVAAGTTSTARSAQSARSTQSYFSAKTQSVALFVRTVNGVAPTTFPFTEVNVGGANSPCTIANGTASCTISIAAPVGSDAFQVMTYPTQNGSNNPISIGNATANVVANQPTTLAVNLLPVVSNVTYTITPSATTAITAPATFTLTLTPLDSAGSAITGPDNFYQPITVSSTASNAHVTSSPALPVTFTTPGQTSMTFTYDGQGTVPSYTFQYGLVGDAFSGSNIQQSVTLSFTSAAQHLYITTQNPNQVLVYDINADSSISANPSRTISGSSTGLTRAGSIWVDANGAIYVNNYLSNVVEFAPGANGNVAPANTLAAGQHPVFVGRGGSTEFAIITLPNYAPSNDTQTRYIAFGTIYQSYSGDGPTFTGGSGFYLQNAGSVAEPTVASGGTLNIVCASFLETYDYTGDGTIECYPNPIAVNGSLYPTAGFAAVNDGPVNVAFRPDGKMVVVSQSIYGGPNANVSTYPQNGGTTPTYQLVAGTAGLTSPQAVAFDNLGNMYVADSGLSSGAARILQFPQNATGAVTATRVIGLSNFYAGYSVAVGP